MTDAELLDYMNAHVTLPDELMLNDKWVAPAKIAMFHIKRGDPDVKVWTPLVGFAASAWQVAESLNLWPLIEENKQ